MDVGTALRAMLLKTIIENVIIKTKQPISIVKCFVYVVSIDTVVSHKITYVN